MPSIIARGRIAWILAMIFGAILIVVGAVISPPAIWLIVTGGGFFAFGLVFLILSLVTKGATD